MGMENERKIKDEEKLNKISIAVYEKKGRIKWADYKSDKISCCLKKDTFLFLVQRFGLKISWTANGAHTSQKRFLSLLIWLIYFML